MSTYTCACGRYTGFEVVTVPCPDCGHPVDKTVKERLAELVRLRHNPGVVARLLEALVAKLEGLPAQTKIRDLREALLAAKATLVDIRDFGDVWQGEADKLCKLIDKALGDIEVAPVASAEPLTENETWRTCIVAGCKNLRSYCGIHADKGDRRDAAVERLMAMVSDLRASVILAMVLAGDQEDWATWKDQVRTILTKHHLNSEGL